MNRLMICVPNFSEGRDPELIRRITDRIAAVEGVELLDVDPGKATNRTVVTFVGAPEAVIEGALEAGRAAAELIDMSKHSGEHPRFGAMDVCPLVPVAGVTMEEAAGHARELARRLGEEAGLTVYCYEQAALLPERRNLASVRAGEYEALEERLRDPRWKPDFGPARFNPRSGATAVGARDFLIAYNVNLNTTSARRANAIAFDVREKGRQKRLGDPLSGPIAKDEQGEPVWIPGSLKCVKGIGWYIEEYGIAQISMNLTDLSVTPIHVAFDECVEKARERGLRVTGSEIVGLVPLEAMREAGRYFLRKQQRSCGVPDAELVEIAAKSMGLDDLTPFDPRKKIIEYVIEDRREQKLLVDRSLKGFTHLTASEAPAPGGGSVAAAVGALGAALGTMVANLSSHKRGWDERWEEFSEWAERGRDQHEELLRLVDEDTRAFDQVLAAMRLPRGSAEEEAARERAVQEATSGAIEVPLRVMEVSLESMAVIQAMAEQGLPSSVSDAGVGALCARTAIMGAYLNVKTNTTDLEDRKRADAYLARARAIQTEAASLEARILDIVVKRMEA